MDRPHVLILDDGELGRVYASLRRMGLAPMRVSGDDIEDGLPMPSELLISTGKRTLAVPQLSVKGGRAPTWICVHTQDFHPLRERLRALGVHYLAQSSASDATLDLFFAQLLHVGGERRLEPRLPIGCEVRWRWNARAPQKAVLLDLSARSIRIETDRELLVGAHIEIALPGELVGDEIGCGALVDRCEAAADRGGEARWVAVLRWDALEDRERELIEGLASGRRIGTRITPLQDRPYVDGAGIPDWDELARAGDRRSAQRHRYDGHVDAFRAHPGGPPIGVLGRDLSARGLRIDPVDLAEGADLTVAIHGGCQSEPILADARVECVHPDGSRGLVFTALDGATRARIDEVLETLPTVASLAADERILPAEITLR